MSLLKICGQIEMYIDEIFNVIFVVFYLFNSNLVCLKSLLRHI